jgi:hypothetical protein
MSWDDYSGRFVEWPRDNKIDEARAALFERYFPPDGRHVYYGRQLEVALESQFFHWITRYALNELAAEGRIGFTAEKTDTFEAHFYWPLRHRYPRRQIRQILGLINEFSDPDFTRALGHHTRDEHRPHAEVLTHPLLDSELLLLDVAELVLNLDAVAHAIAGDQAIKIVVARGPSFAVYLSHLALQDAEADSRKANIDKGLAMMCQRAISTLCTAAADFALFSRTSTTRC